MGLSKRIAHRFLSARSVQDLNNQRHPCKRYVSVISNNTSDDDVLPENTARGGRSSSGSSTEASLKSATNHRLHEDFRPCDDRQQQSHCDRIRSSRCTSNVFCMITEDTAHPHSALAFLGFAITITWQVSESRHTRTSCGHDKVSSHVNLRVFTSWQRHELHPNLECAIIHRRPTLRMTI